MNAWFPKFLNIGPAALAAAIAIPSLLILYFLKLRRKEFAVASTLLWKRAIADLQVNAPFQKLRKNLLLLLQLLLIALLVLAFARPITFFSPGAGKSSVIIIDHSASMSAMDVNGHSRLDEAKRRAKDLIATMGRGASAMVISADDSAQIVQPWTADAVWLARSVESISPTQRPSRLKQAYEIAEAQSHAGAGQLRPTNDQPDVYVYSDGRVLDANELKLSGNLKYEKIGSENAGNIAVVALRAKRNYDRPNEVQVFARLANFGDQPVDADVELWISPIDPAQIEKDAFTNRGAAVVKLFPQRWNEAQRDAAQKNGTTEKDSVEFTLDITTAATIRVEQKNRVNDMLAADDSAEVVLPPPKTLSVLLVSDGNYFLERALASLDLKNPQTISPAEYETKKPSGFDVVIFDRQAPKTLPAAGNFLYFGCLPSGLKLTQVIRDDQPVMLHDVGVLDWQRDHPMLRDLSLTKLFAADALSLNVPNDSQVLVEGTGGPLVVLDREGRSLNLVVAFDLLRSNWPLRVSFPIFLHNAMQFMALGAQLQAPDSLHPGATPRIPLADVKRVDPNLKSIRVVGPNDSREVAIPASGDLALPPLEDVGVYRLEPNVPQYDRIAVSLLDWNESNLVPLDQPPGNVGAAVANAGERSRVELWWWIIACGVVPLMLVEWWVYTRRVHL